MLNKVTLKLIIYLLGISFTNELTFSVTANTNNRLYNIPLNSTRNMSKFCANLSFLFSDKPMSERYQLAKNAGFQAVETGFPVDLEMGEVVAAKNAAGVEQVLINVYTGDVTKGELGFAAIPGKEKEFKESIEKTIQYAKALGAKKIHIMSGKVSGLVTTTHDRTYESNLRYATELLEKENLIGLIEPINKYSIPHYYMNSYDKAVSVIEKINSPNLKLMLDIFHLQLIKGNIAHSLSELKNYIGHIQIAQAPDRHEPTTDGEINYKYVLEILKKEGYNDWIGLEYKPLGDTKEGLKWLHELGYSL